MAPRARVKEVIGLLSTLFEAAAGVEAILLGPLSRYMEGPCCAKNSHMEGYSKETHLNDTLTMMHEVRKGLKDILRDRRATGIRAANFTKTILECAGPWQDAIYPNTGCYQTLIERILQEMASRLAERNLSGGGGQKRPREDSGRQNSPAKRKPQRRT